MPHGPVEIFRCRRAQAASQHIRAHTSAHGSNLLHLRGEPLAPFSFKRSAMQCNHITFQQTLTARDTAFGARNRFRSTRVCRRQLNGIVTGVSCI